MRSSKSVVFSGILITSVFCALSKSDAAPPATVPPGMEIEVLDPSVDANGDPAVELRREPNTGRYLVDIPTVVLVHRYYYTGNRSFRGPMMPDGPTIAVVNHPRTGERQYIELQMMPGAPRVHYTSRKIEYNFGNHGISIVFGKLREVPVVKYRNHTKASTAVESHFEESGLPETAEKIQTGMQRASSKAKTMAGNMTVVLAKGLKAAATPVVKVAKLVPGMHWVLNPNSDQATGAAIAEFHRNTAVRHASQEAYQNSGSISTVH